MMPLMTRLNYPYAQNPHNFTMVQNEELLLAAKYFIFINFKIIITRENQKKFIEKKIKNQYVYNNDIIHLTCLKSLKFIVNYPALKNGVIIENLI